MQNPISYKALALALVSTAVILTPFATAENAPMQAHASKLAAKAAPAPTDGERDMHQCFMNQLNLSSEQSQKVKALMDEGHKQGHALKAQIRAKRRSLMQYLQSPDASLPKALTLNTEINSLQRQLGELRLKTFFAMRDQLTPEQRQKLRQLQKNRMAQHGHQSCGQRNDASGKKGAAMKTTPGKPAKP